jgi:hypothetical protein
MQAAISMKSHPESELASFDKRMTAPALPGLEKIARFPGRAEAVALALAWPLKITSRSQSHPACNSGRRSSSPSASLLRLLARGHAQLGCRLLSASPQRYIEDSATLLDPVRHAEPCTRRAVSILDDRFRIRQQNDPHAALYKRPFVRQSTNFKS